MDIPYFHSSDVDLDVALKIEGLDRVDALIDSTQSDSVIELFATCSLRLYGGVVVTEEAATARTPVKGFHVDSTESCIDFDQTLFLPVKYRDLQATSELLVTIWQIPCTSTEPVAIGGASIPLFDQFHNTLQYGRVRVALTPNMKGEQVVESNPCDPNHALHPLEKRLKLYLQRPLPRVPFLDRLVVRAVNRVYPSRTARLERGETTLDEVQEGDKSNVAYVRLSMPEFPAPVLYSEEKVQDEEVVEELFPYADPDAALSNPIEEKFHKLTRSLRHIDVKVKPKVSERNELQRILTSPNKNLTSSDKALMWRFRHTLVDDHRALTKFVRCVDWSDVEEAKQAHELMERWAPIETVNALELLSPVFTNRGVRDYAVRVLDKADDTQLQLYLLQLVQALRYEHTIPSALSNFLIRRCIASMESFNYLWWYVQVEQAQQPAAPLYTAFQEELVQAVEAYGEKGNELNEMKNRQHKLITQLLALSREAKAFRRERVDKRIERLRYLLSEDGTMAGLRSFDKPVRLPVRPSVIVTGVKGEESTLYKSALQPLGLVFTTSIPGNDFRIIFKTGDDLRQDQLMIQMIELMDRMLKRVNLDLKLTAYRVLATSHQDGFVEFVPNSRTLTYILSKYSYDIRKFFQAQCDKPHELQAILDTFVKSAAGYCVITYILGIGDRHLDNLLLDTSGHLFHIDFGYIFGQDPKPLPPPFKLCKEMVMAMGGSDSQQYKAFELYCCQAFNVFRKGNQLILNLLSLMRDAGIQDMAGNVDQVLLKVQEKFRLDLSDEEAETFFLKLIHESVSALFPQVVEKIHRWALYWK